MGERAINNYQKDFYKTSLRQTAFSKAFSEIIQRKKMRAGHLEFLDIGCGNGGVAIALYDYFDGKASVVGVDSTGYEAWTGAPEGVSFHKISCFDSKR